MLFPSARHDALALLTLWCNRHEGYLIVGSGMAVHSFRSIDEIREAKTEEEREAVRAKVLAESRTFDAHIRKTVQHRDAGARRKALLELEFLYEFKRSHPTVEVSLMPRPMVPSVNIT